MMSFIVATNVVASQPAKRRLTGTPTAHANSVKTETKKNKKMPKLASMVLFILGQHFRLMFVFFWMSKKIDERDVSWSLSFMAEVLCSNMGQNYGC